LAHELEGCWSRGGDFDSGYDADCAPSRNRKSRGRAPVFTLPVEERKEALMTHPLRNVRLFQSFSELDRAELFRFMHPRKYASGETICTCGEHGSTMLVVTAGALSAVVSGKDNQPHEIASLKPDSVFGEMFCIDPAPRPVTVVARETTTVLELGRDDLIRMRQQAPRAAAALISAVFRDVLRRLRCMGDRIDRELRADSVLDDTTPEPRTSRDDLPGAWKPCFAGLRGSA
jgi:CRP/FNR family transcriptional regulator, cyclic AMP receptor protein